MSSTDETYLESFIENIATLPNEVRRNLEHMKELDRSCAAVVEQLRRADEEYVNRATEEISSIPLSPELRDDSKGRDTIASLEGAGSTESPEDDETDNRNDPGPSGLSENKRAREVIPTTEELRYFIEDLDDLDRIAKCRQSACRLADEKVAVADQTYTLVDAAVKRLDADLEKFEAAPKAAGEFEAAGGGRPNDLAAIQVTPNSADWILAKVISHDPGTGMYTLSDEDVESSKIFHLPESQVVVLGGVERLSRGDIIYAVYPDTTSFYQATVVQAPRKVSGGGSFVMVNFKDDSDEHGVTHDKAVLMKHVMRVPYGVLT